MHRAPSSPVLLVAVLLVAGCGAGGSGTDGGPSVTCTGTGGGGGGATGTNSVTGSINAAPFAAQSAIAQRFTGSDYGSPPKWYDGLVVRLSESAPACNANGGFGLAKAGKRVLDLTIRQAPDAGVVTAGTQQGSLSVRSPDCATLSGCGNGMQCARLTGVEGGQVTVTLTDLSTRVKGSFTGTLGSGAPISGSFDADYCAFYDWEMTDAVQCAP